MPPSLGPPLLYPTLAPAHHQLLVVTCFDRMDFWWFTFCHQHRRHHRIVGAYTDIILGYYDCCYDENEVPVLVLLAARRVSRESVTVNMNKPISLCFHHFSLFYLAIAGMKHSVEFLCKSTECSCVVDQSNDSHPSTFLLASKPPKQSTKTTEDSTVPEAKRILHCCYCT